MREGDSGYVVRAGWTDPILANAFGASSPAAKILSYAGHNTVNVLRASPGVDEPVVRNGAAAADASGAAVAANRIVVRGSDGGLDFGLGVSRSAPQTVWDATFSRPVNTSFTGEMFDVKGIRAMRFGLAPQTLASCTASPASDPAQRCIYPDAYNGTWNVSLTYASPTLITLPHFLQADESLAASTGARFAPDPDVHGYKFGVEPVTGLTVYGWKGFQFVHLVRPTDLLYRDLWMNASVGTGGMWMPSFWVRSRFQATDTGAKALGGGLERAKREHRSMRDRRESTARDAKLSKDELADLTHAAADDGDGPGANGGIGAAISGGLNRKLSGAFSRRSSRDVAFHGGDVQLARQGSDYVGWGGNFLTMQNMDEPGVSAAEVGVQSPLLDPPGLVQEDGGGPTLESLIIFRRRSTTASSWGVLPEDFLASSSPLTRPSNFSQVSSSSTGKSGQQMQNMRRSTSLEGQALSLHD
ncbi:hypothetical protein WJX75_002617 [Coccomyxa subellipsoidea]|uniref:Uncharacterized protein n=1 Tax=Coccomyxa subellipsoidea TaxID=248742 RepID=A0ABR2Z021_9CHLO